MTMTTQGDQPRASDVLDALDPAGALDTTPMPGGRRYGRWLLTGLVLVIVVGLSAAGFAHLAGAFGGPDGGNLLTHEVTQAELLITITEDGNLESANNKDIKCEVAGGSTILWIVEDGKLVEKDEELVRLDSSQLQDQINQQKITYEKAHAAHIQAEKDHKVAEISVEEYLEGTYRKELQDLQAQITVALENLRSAQNTLKHTQRMFRKGYVSPLQREAQEFAVQRAQLELESAQTAKEVLEKFTKTKTLEDLRSKRDTAEAKKNAEKASLDLEEARLNRYQAQREKCVILAPQAGMAVYANLTGRHRFGSQQPQIEEGAMVREQQTLFRLPDLSQMQVKVTVHESKVDQLERGMRARTMRARIRVQDREYQGTVDSIANQPESGGFFGANVKEYATTVKIDGQQEGIKPGMTAEVEILVAHLKDVVTLPVAAVVQQRDQFYCWVKEGKDVQRRPLVLGLSNDKYVEVRDGVAVGEQVVLNPRAVVDEARQEGYQEEQIDVDQKFGAAPEDGKQAPPTEGGRDAKRGPRPDRERGGPAAGGPGHPQMPSADGPPPSGRPGGPPSGAGGPRGGLSGMREKMMAMDKDGDGKLSRQEAEQMGGFFDRLDENGDGFIQPAEIDAMQKRFRQGGGRPGGGRPGGGAPGGGRPGGGAPGGGRPGGGPPGGSRP